jgi:hypothetical protein
MVAMAAPGRAALLATALLFGAFFPSAFAASSYPASELLSFRGATVSFASLPPLIKFYSASGGRDCGQAPVHHGVGGGQAAVVAQIGRHQDG